MTLNQLRAFLAAARLGSFTAAAAALEISQASVSELVRRLEDDYALPLFVRGPRRLVLTPAGNELLPLAEASVAAADHAHQSLRALRSLEGGEVSFGLPRNADYYGLSDLAREFHTRYPRIRLRLMGQNSVEVAAAVASGGLEAGIAVLPLDTPTLTVVPLLRDEVVYVSSDPLRAAAPVTIQDLAERDLILYDAHYGWTDPTRRQLAERAQLEGLRLAALVEVEQVDTALGLVAGGVGDTVVSRAVANSPTFPAGLHTAGFAEPLYDTIALVHRASTPMSVATQELARMATEMLRGTGVRPCT